LNVLCLFETQPLPNNYQKVLNSWEFFTAAFVIAVFLGAFIIGKEKSNALGWPFTKIFK